MKQNQKKLLIGAMVVLNTVLFGGIARQAVAKSGTAPEACLRENCRCNGTGSGAQCSTIWVVPGSECTSQSECTRPVE
jgi:hypothetical protein